MSLVFARRQFCKLSLGLAPVELALRHPEAAADAHDVDVIFEILSRSFGLTEEQKPLAAAFLQRLLTPGMHPEAPQQVRQWLANLSFYRQTLMAYVAEEFVVGSNYFAVVAGHEGELKVIPV